eukprot:GHVS01038326.1.p1 GENE.GHVS01038326.1~~GHVS01038326.1.p1  ORF type:complete len:500 (+),score=86.36 GHVS01038326.1:52-1551(+)
MAETTTTEAATTDGVTSEGGSQVEVSFTTKLEDPQFRLQDDQSFLVPTELQRLGLSELLNTLLELPAHQPFDFLIEGNFLRTSLKCYLQSEQRTTEGTLTVEYALAVPKPTTEDLHHTHDWISSIHTFRDNTVCVGNYDGSVSLYRGSRQLAALQLSPSPVTSVAVCDCLHKYSAVVADEQQRTEVIASLKNGQIRFSLFGMSEGDKAAEWTNRTVAIGKGHKDAAQCVAVAGGDGGLAVSGGWDSKLLLWNNSDILSDETLMASPDTSCNGKRGREVAPVEVAPRMELKGHDKAITDICFPSFEPFKYNLISSSLDQSLRAWDFIAGAAVSSWNAARVVTSLSFCPSGQQLSTSHDDGRVRIWDLRLAEGCVADSPDPVKSFDSNTRLQLSHAYNVHKRIASCCRWNPHDPVTVASVSHDGTLRILDVRALRVPLQSVVMADNVTNGNVDEPKKILACDWMDRYRVVTGGEDGVLRIHDTSGGINSHGTKQIAAESLC